VGGSERERVEREGDGLISAQRMRSPSSRYIPDIHREKPMVLDN